ncbi:MAG TPA: SRPBCC domain-containing protein [Bryobacteraceae bacterium]|jgi:uncharacterized protein YndB with AHSA1/START domain
MAASALESNSAFTVTTPSDREIVMTRVFHAPRHLVFEAWTKPEHMAHWWGWRGSTLPVCELDLRPGGAWRRVLRTPDGKEYPFKGTIREIAAPGRLVYTECFDEPSVGSPEWITTATFEERDGKTKLTATILHPSKEARDAHLKSGMEAGAAHSLDRLAEHLDTQAREIVITRVFDAPRELVFEMWTDPKHLVHWWGPRGFTTTIQEMDVRPGGQWRKIMHGPDGANYPNHSVFLEVVKPERLVYTHGGRREGGPSVEFEQTVTFDDVGGKTRVTMRLLFPSAAERERVVRQFNAIEGGNQTLDRLGERLAEMNSGDKELVITRIFDAPREVVFKAWTDPERLKRWWGPKNFTNPVCEVDVRPGGAMRIDMRGPDGKLYPMTGIYHEIVEPDRLIFTASALDANRDPLFEQMTIVTFEDQGGKTKLTVHASFSKVRAEAAPHLAGAETGWNMSLDRLADETAPKALRVTRVFDAPRDLVWKAVTEGERLMHWWGPKGFTPLTCEVDLRKGGTFRFSLRAPDGSMMWGKWVYGEIVAPELLVSVTSMTDEAGNPMRHPMAGTFPTEVLYTMTLSERDGKTTMIVSGVPFNATEEERKAFETGRDYMEQGFDGTLNKLAAYLLSNSPQN